MAEESIPDNKNKDDSANNAGRGSAARVSLGQDIVIDPSKPRDDLAPPNVKAYEGYDSRQSKDLLVLLTGREYVPRVLNIASYRNIKNPNLLPLREAGIVDWPLEGRQMFAVAYEKPSGKKVTEDLDRHNYRIDDGRIVASLVKPLLFALNDMRNVDFLHGAVNTLNMYRITSEAGESVILGDCISVPPSFNQPVLFESIERAMAQPSGRGLGTEQDEIYALGVSVALMLRGRNVLAGLSDEEIIHEKIEHGSYAAILGRERVPSGISEFLRGALNDDASQRWSIDDALKWLEGQRNSRKQPRMLMKAARPFVVKEKKYWNVRSVAQSLSENIPEAIQVFEQGHFYQWVKRNFEDKDMVENLEIALGIDKEGNSSLMATQNKEKFVSQACIALDPVAPVRYKGVAVFPRGFGTALAYATAQKQDIVPYTELLRNQLFSFWYNTHTEEMSDSTTILSQFERCKGYLAQRFAGYGIERVLYTLCKEAPCMSPALDKHYAMGPGGILTALEDISKQPNRPDSILDRHMIAFISVRDGKMIDGHMSMLISNQPSFYIVGVLRTLALIQQKYKIDSVPGVLNWIISLIDPALERFYDHDLRQDVAKRIVAYKENGDLIGLLNLVDDGNVLKEDSARFMLARREYALLTNEKIALETQLKRKRIVFGRTTGRQVAMLVSAFISAIIIIVYLLVHFIGRPF